MTSLRRPSWPSPQGAVALLLPLALYVRTLAPTVYNLDSAELTTAAATGGIVRATGYPLYLALGWVWSSLPIGDVGYRMNLLSAVAGAMTIFLADRILRRPGVAAFALLVMPSALRRPRLIAAAVLGLAIGLLPVLYLPLRHAAAPEFNYAGAYDAAGDFHPVDLQHAGGILWLMSGRSFSAQMLGYSASDFVLELWRQIIVLNRAFLGIGLGPGLIGMIVLFRRRHPLALMLALFAGCNALFFAGYRVVDKETMYLPVFLVWALWVAVGYRWLLEWVGERREGAHTAWGRALSLAMAAAVLVGAALTWPLADRSDDDSARQRGEQVLDAVAPNALVIGWWDTIPVVEYLQLVEGERPDVTAINRFLIPGDALTALLRREVARRPVYVDSVPEALMDEVHVIDAEPLLRLMPLDGAP